MKRTSYGQKGIQIVQEALEEQKKTARSKAVRLGKRTGKQRH